MRWIKRVLCFIMVLCLAIQVNTSQVSATPAIGKTSIISINQVGKKSMKIVWKKVAGAKGYVLQYRKRGKTWKNKTTKKTNFTLTGLQEGEKYQIRVCAYKNINGKKKYGKHSVIKQKSMLDYVYLVDAYKPYNSSYYEAYADGKYFYMGAVKQKNSFILGQDFTGVDKKADFNIEGKYSNLSFDVGKVDSACNSPYDGDFDVSIYLDGILTKVISVKVEALPVKVHVPVQNAERLTFEVEEDACTLVGFSNVKLFYK